MKFLKKISKILIIILPFFIFFAYMLKYNLPVVVEYGLRIFINSHIKAEKISFKAGQQIEAENVRIFYKGDKIIEAPRVYLSYSKKFRIKKIEIPEFEALIKRNRERINIVDAFSDPHEEGSKKSGAKVPINLISFSNGRVKFIENSYTIPMEEKAENVEGNLFFDRKKGIILSVKGNLGAQKIEFGFKNEDYKYDMMLVLKDKEIRKETLQYIYEDEKIKNFSGKLNLNLRIIPNKFYGEVIFTKGEGKYSDFEASVSDIEGRVDFKGEIIDIDFKYLLAKRYLGELKGTYKNKNLEINSKNNFIPYEIVKAYLPIKELNLPLGDLMFEELNLKFISTPTIKFRTEIDYKIGDLKKKNYNLKNLNGKVSYENNEFEISSKNIDFELPEINYKKRIDYNLTLKVLNKDMTLKFDSNIVKFDGYYNRKWKDLKIFKDSKTILDYNIRKNRLNYLNLELDRALKDYKFKLKGQDEKKYIKLNMNLMKKDANTKSLEIDGEIEKERLKYNLNIEAVEADFNLGTLEMKSTFNGKITGEEKKFKFYSKMMNFDVKNAEKEIKGGGELNLDFINKTEMQFTGKIDEILYEQYKIKNLQTKLDLKNNILNMRIGNDYLNIDGNIDLENKELEVDYQLNRFFSKDLKQNKINFEIENGYGKIDGNLENIKMTLNLKEAFLESDDKKIKLSGIIDYNNSEFSTKKFKLNESLMDFYYNLRLKKGKFQLKLLEKNLSKYIKYNELEYNRLNGKIDGDILDNNIKLQLDMNISKGYFMGNRLPDLKLIGDYTYAKDLNILELKSIEWLDEKNSRIVHGNASLDLKNELYKVIFPEQTSKITFSIENGLDIETRLKASLIKKGAELEYLFESKDGKITMDGVKLDKMELEIKGDLERISIPKLIVYHKKNRFTGKGEYYLKDKKYSLKLESSDFDLEFINPILAFNKINNIADLKGKIDFNLNFSSDNKNSGFIRGENLSFNMKKDLLSFREFYLNSKLEGNKITFEEIKGILNGGTITGKGDIILPKFKRNRSNQDYLKNLDYSLYLSQSNGHYFLKDYFSLDVSSNLYISKKRIMGNLTVNSGEITGIYEEQQSLLIKALSYVLDKIKASLGEDREFNKKFNLESKLLKTPYFNINLELKDGLKVDIPEISTIVQDLKGRLDGKIKFEGKDEKLFLIGELELLNGSFSLGNEDFRVERAIIISNKLTGKIVDFNPNISLNISTLVPGKNLELALQGNLKDLRLNVKTNKGVQSSSLRNVFNSNERSYEEPNGLGIVLKTVIDSQISSTFFRPITSRMKKFFRIEKFRIVSDIFNENFFTSSDLLKGDTESLMGMGAYLELENNLYKDKYYWNLKIGLLDPSDYENSNINILEKMNRYSGSVNQFNFKIERRYRSGWSYGVGVAKLKDNKNLDEKIRGKMNYYVDFQFKKKYNNISEIIFKKK